MKIEVTITDTSGAMTKADANAAVREGYRTIGATWQAKFRKRHFTSFGFTGYGYTPRTKRYDAQKRRRTGQVLPLVLSGDSRDLSENARIDATRNGVAVVSGVKNFNYGGGKRVDMLKEFRTVIPSEQEELDRRASRAVERQVKREIVYRTTRID